MRLLLLTNMPPAPARRSGGAQRTDLLLRALAKLGDDPEPLVEVANRGTAHMYITNPLKKARATHGQKDSVFSSHPPLRKRIAALLALLR